MPRKPKPPPVWDMYVEGLSTGPVREAVPTEFVDDFTGDVMPMVQRPAPRPKRHGRVMTDLAQRKLALRVLAQHSEQAQRQRVQELVDQLQGKGSAQPQPSHTWRRF